MTDARLPARWLTNARFLGLTDHAFRIFANGLMWSTESGTDGAIPTAALRLLHPGGEYPQAYTELVEAGLWEVGQRGFQVVDWEKTQSTFAQVEAAREASRLRSQRSREAKASRALATAAKSREHAAEPDVTPNVTRDVRRTDLGQDRQGQDRQGQVVREAAPDFGDLRLTDWETASIPTADMLDD